MTGCPSPAGLQDCPSGRAERLPSTENQNDRWVIRPRLRHTATPSDIDGVDSAFRAWESLGDHPGIVPVRDWECSSRISYAVPAPATGTVRRQLDNPDAVIWADEAVWLTRKLCTAVGYAHDAGITHGALDPSTIYLYAGSETARYRPAIADWQLAACLDAGTEAIWAQPRSYVAPEQRRPRETDERTDCFQLGAICYELLTGSPPVDDDCLAVTGPLDAAEPVPPSEQTAAVPKAVDAPVLRALQRDPADRFDTVEEFAVELASVDLDPSRKAAATEQSQPVPVADWHHRHGQSVAPGLDSLSGAHVQSDRDGSVWEKPAVRWQYRTDGAVDSALAFAHDTVLAASAGGTVTALNAATGESRWERTLDTHGTPALSAGAGFVAVSHAGTVTVFDVQTGKQQWQRELGAVQPPAIVPTHRSPPADQSPAPRDRFDTTTMIVSGEYDGSVYAITAASGETRWQTETDATLCTAPTVTETAVYVGSINNGVLAVGGEDEIQWEFATGSRIVGRPSAGENCVYAVERDGTVYAVSRADCAVQWRTSIEYQPGGRQTVAGSSLYVGSGSTGRGSLCSIDRESGQREWRYSLDECVTTRPVLADGTVLIGTKEGLHGVDSGSGTQRYRLDLDAAVCAGPTVATRNDQTVMYVGDDGYFVTALERESQ
jgi:outer membrane protein assembly factor BamB